MKSEWFSNQIGYCLDPMTYHGIDAFYGGIFPLSKKYSKAMAWLILVFALNCYLANRGWTRASNRTWACARQRYLFLFLEPCFWCCATHSIYVGLSVG